MRITALSALLGGAAIVLTACGGTASGTATTAGGSSGSSGSGSGAGGSASTAGQGLHVATTSLGKVLVDQRGRTVYLLTADGRDMSTCGGDCLSLWPAVAPAQSRLGLPIGSTKTPDGTATATVAGQPVYTFANDHGPGDVSGQGVRAFGGTWYAVSPSGQAITGAGGGAGSNSGSTSGSPGPYGGGY